MELREQEKTDNSNETLVSRRKTSIDDKIDSLINWLKKYPTATIQPVNKYFFDENIRSKEELIRFNNEFKRMNEYYNYLRERKSKNKLNPDQIARCKEGNLGGVFGYSSAIEEMASRYNITQPEMYQMISEYGSIDGRFDYVKKLEKNNGILNYGLKIKTDTIIKNVFDIDMNPNNNYDNLFTEIVNLEDEVLPGFYTYSSEEIIKKLDELDERKKQIIINLFGLNDGVNRSLVDVANEFGVTSERIRQSKLNALSKLKNSITIENYNDLRNSNTLNEEERNRLDLIEKKLRLQLIDKNNQGDLEDIQFLKSIKERVRTQQIEQQNSPITSLALSKRAKTGLLKAGIQTIDDLKGLTREELLSIRCLGEKSCNEILTLLDQKDMQKSETTSLVKMDHEKQELLEEVNELKGKVSKAKAFNQEVQDEINKEERNKDTFDGPGGI